MSERIFLSYRRDDDPGFAQALFARLEAEFGQERLFMDVSGIRPGDDFTEVIDRKVAACDVLLAVIGQRWLSIADSKGSGGLTTLTTSLGLKSKRHCSQENELYPCW